MAEAVDPDALHTVDPFEIDAANRPHLYAHHATDDAGRTIGLGEQDLYDVYFNDPMFRPADHPPAEWFMIGEIPGGLILLAPLAPPRSGDPTRVRPIGLYQAGREEEDEYRRWQRGEVDD